MKHIYEPSLLAQLLRSAIEDLVRAGLRDGLGQEDVYKALSAVSRSVFFPHEPAPVEYKFSQPLDHVRYLETLGFKP